MALAVITRLKRTVAVSPPPSAWKNIQFLRLCGAPHNRKNWLFFQTEGGGETAVVLLSLVMTAKAIGLDPRIYLRDVMLRIARESDVAKLTPHGWREHFQAEVEAERAAALARFAGA
jgi:hypothetical protein